MWKEMTNKLVPEMIKKVIEGSGLRQFNFCTQCVVRYGVYTPNYRNQHIPSFTFIWGQKKYKTHSGD